MTRGMAAVRELNQLGDTRRSAPLSIKPVSNQPIAKMVPVLLHDYISFARVRRKTRFLAKFSISKNSPKKFGPKKVCWEMLLYTAQG